MLLAIDSSTSTCSIALFGDEVVAERSWRTSRNHTRELLPGIDALLRDAGATIADVTGVGVALGPGSFNGLRVGLATAKMLAFSRGLPLSGVGTLELAALPLRLSGRLIRTIVDAGRGQIATALYDSHPDWIEREEPSIRTLTDCLASDPPSVVYSGELKDEWIGEIERSGAGRLVPSPGTRLRRAGFLAEAARRRIAAGRRDDIASLQPLYLRRPNITTPRS